MASVIPLKYCRKVNLKELKRIAADARGEIDMVYAHWTAGHYSQGWDSYHVLIDDDGTIYVTTDDFTEYKSHTWRRNGNAIGIAMMCAYGAIANEGWNADMGDEPPTAEQVEALAQATAVIAEGLQLEITRDNFMTHCEAAFEDGYGPFQGDPDLRWDLWYLRDFYGDYAMKDGGNLWRGKANFYRNTYGD